MRASYTSKAWAQLDERLATLEGEVFTCPVCMFSVLGMSAFFAHASYCWQVFRQVGFIRRLLNTQPRTPYFQHLYACVLCKRGAWPAPDIVLHILASHSIQEIRSRGKEDAPYSQTDAGHGVDEVSERLACYFADFGCGGMGEERVVLRSRNRGHLTQARDRLDHPVGDVLDLL